MEFVLKFQRRIQEVYCWISATTNTVRCKDPFITYSKSLEESDEMDAGKVKLVVASGSIHNQLFLCWWLLKHASTYPSY